MTTNSGLKLSHTSALDANEKPRVISIVGTIDSKPAHVLVNIQSTADGTEPVTVDNFKPDGSETVKLTLLDTYLESLKSYITTNAHALQLDDNQANHAINNCQWHVLSFCARDTRFHVGAPGSPCVLAFIGNKHPVYAGKISAHANTTPAAFHFTGNFIIKL